MKKYGLLDLIDDIIGFTIIGVVLAILCIISEVLKFFVVVGVMTFVLWAIPEGICYLIDYRKEKKEFEKRGQR